MFTSPYDQKIWFRFQKLERSQAFRRDVVDFLRRPSGVKLIVDEDAPDADCALDGETLLVIAAKETKKETRQRSVLVASSTRKRHSRTCL